MSNPLRRTRFSNDAPPSLTDNAHGFPLRHCRAIESGTKRRELLEHSSAWAEAYEQAQRLGADGNDWLDVCLAFLGPRGTGKTQAATLLSWLAESDGYTARYSTAFEFFLAIKASFNTSTQSEDDVLKRFLSPSLLVLDELQERGDTPFEDRMLTHLVDRRYRDCKATILIANLKPDAFAAALGSSIMRRVNETGGVIEFLTPIQSAGV